MWLATMAQEVCLGGAGVYERVSVRWSQTLCRLTAHCLILVIVHSCTEKYVCNMVSTVQTVAFAFNFSAKRLLTFKVKHYFTISSMLNFSIVFFSPTFSKLNDMRTYVYSQ